jgi:hypothetical protein
MTKHERDRAEARFNKAARAAEDARSGKTARDAATNAVLDNMARLKALRLAKQAAEPAAAAVPGNPRPGRAKKSQARPLGDWLSSQQSGGRRT